MSREALTYEPGYPCRNGHNSARYVRSSECVACRREHDSAVYQRRMFDPVFVEHRREKAREYKKTYKNKAGRT